MNLDTFMHDMNMLCLCNNDYMYDQVKSIRCYDKCKLCIEQVKNMIPMTILGFP
jgi:hypothetical protein